MNEIAALIRVERVLAFSHALSCEVQGKGSGLQPRRGLSPEPVHVDAPMTSRTVRNKVLLFISHPSIWYFVLTARAKTNSLGNLILLTWFLSFPH